MCDEDDGATIGTQGAQHIEEAVRFLGGEHGGGLVQDEYLGIAVQGLDDFHALQDTNRHRLHARCGVHGQAVALRDLGDVSTGLLLVDQAATDGLMPEYHVLCDRQGGKEFEGLEHHADAGMNGVER